MSRLLTPQELADRWQVNVAWVYSKTRSGEIPKAPLPSRYFGYREDVIERLERGEENHDVSHANPATY